MLFLITVPANSTRGPRYMEKSLAAIHQARLRHRVTLIYGSSDEQVGLFVRCHAADREAVLEPIVANYPHATVTVVEEGSRSGECATAEHTVWYSDIQLVPELFPILFAYLLATVATGISISAARLYGKRIPIGKKRLTNWPNWHIVPERDIFCYLQSRTPQIFPIGNTRMVQVNDAIQIGQLVRQRRKEAGMTLKDAAALAGVGVRFLSELERGKPTLQMGLAIRVLHLFGLELHVEQRGDQHA